MQVALHFGAPYSDENRLQLCLGKNRARLGEVGTFVPRPSSYRKALRPVLNKLRENPQDEAVKEAFLHDVLGDERPDRIVFSNDTFLGIPRLAVAEDQFFPGPFNRLHSFMYLFEGAQVELFYGIRNPATFLQCLMRDYDGDDFSALLGHSDPMNLVWSDFLRRIKDDFPTINLTVWCNEDTPMIWDEVVREVAGVDPTFEIDGSFDIVKELMSEEGFQRFTHYLSERPALTGPQRRRVIAAFLEKFVDEDALEEEVDVPGWTEQYVDAMTDAYDEDIYEIQRIPGVKFISP
jgi:hypothetical protein